MDRLSRKDFLKLAGFTVLGLAGCKFGDAATQTAATAGQPVSAAAGSAAVNNNIVNNSRFMEKGFLMDKRSWV